MTTKSEARTNPQTLPGHMACVYSLPDGVPYDEQPTVARLHSSAGSMSWTYEQYVAEQEQLDLPAVDETTWQSRRISGLQAFRAQFDAAEAEIVRDARRAGVTWETIGLALGTTRQAAQQRFGGGK